ncbi:MAG: hypothetical protein SGPRY_003904, partial [Prymnesium sp.]
LDAVVWRLDSPGQPRRVRAITKGFLSRCFAKTYQLRFPRAQSELSVPKAPVMQIDLGVLRRRRAYDGVFTWSEPLVGVAMRLSRLLALRKQTWPSLALASGVSSRPGDAIRGEPRGPPT